LSPLVLGVLASVTRRDPQVKGCSHQNFIITKTIPVTTICTSSAGLEFVMGGKKQMAATSSKTDLQATIDEQQDLIDQIGDIIDESLDPILTREEIIEKLQQIDDLLEGEDEEDEDEETP
jgi:hypothetical protein